MPAPASVASPGAPPGPPVPILDVGAGGGPGLLAAAPDRAHRLLDRAEKRYLGRLPLILADRVSRSWLERTGNPYLAEIDAIAAALGRPGAHMLNLSFEWACTAGVGPDPTDPDPTDPQGESARLLRTLDWDLGGLGENLVVARQEGAAGPWLNVTWPGFAGALTVMAPGRFAVTINQPPMRRTRIGPIGMPKAWDWIAVRAEVLRSTAIPPAHLLRRVCDTARSFDEARAALTDTPVCLPVFYTLCGLAPTQGCVIERMPDRAFVFEAPVVAANHWQTPGFVTHARTPTSPERHALMTRLMTTAEAFDWLAPPVINPTTRLAVVANPRRGTLLVQGIESSGPVTAPTAVTAAPALAA